MTDYHNATNERRIALLHASIQPASRALLKASAARGISLLVVQGYRSIAEQDRLYAQGRTLPGPVVTKVPGGRSWHNYGLAFDVVPVSDIGNPNWNAAPATWLLLGTLGEAEGLTWGGRWTGFPDRPHFQRTGGLTIDQASAGMRPGVPATAVAGDAIKDLNKGTT
jgi:peptidoglycan L-alanyl-D-glutamate endopeptidase CwlK